MQQKKIGYKETLSELTNFYTLFVTTIKHIRKHILEIRITMFYNLFIFLKLQYNSLSSSSPPSFKSPHVTYLLLFKFMDFSFIIATYAHVCVSQIIRNSINYQPPNTYDTCNLVHKYMYVV